jgi:hypothetical protein
MATKLLILSVAQIKPVFQFYFPILDFACHPVLPGKENCWIELFVRRRMKQSGHSGTAKQTIIKKENLEFRRK